MGLCLGRQCLEGLRAEQTRLYALVVIGVNEYGKKRFLVIEDGVRESIQGWRAVLLKLKSCGMNDRSDPPDGIPTPIFSITC